MSYAPCQSGIIAGTFSVSSRQGMQEHKLHVLCKDLVKPEIQLSLKLDIPELVAMRLGFLLSQVNAELSAKVISVECDSTVFAVENLPSVEGSEEHEVIVAPLKTEAKSRILIKFTVVVADSDPKTIFANALIR